MFLLFFQGERKEATYGFLLLQIELRSRSSRREKRREKKGERYLFEETQTKPLLLLLSDWKSRVIETTSCHPLCYSSLSPSLSLFSRERRRGKWIQETTRPETHTILFNHRHDRYSVYFTCHRLFISLTKKEKSILFPSLCQRTLHLSLFFCRTDWPEVFFLKEKGYHQSLCRRKRVSSYYSCDGWKSSWIPVNLTDDFSFLPLSILCC